MTAFESRNNLEAHTGEAETGSIQTSKRCKFGLAPKVIDALLGKLACDDDFRDLFTRDPEQALASIGHESPTAIRGVLGLDPVLCLKVTTLASKEAIRASSLSIREDLHIFGPFDIGIGTRD